MPATLCLCEMTERRREKSSNETHKRCATTMLNMENLLPTDNYFFTSDTLVTHRHFLFLFFPRTFISNLMVRRFASVDSWMLISHKTCSMFVLRCGKYEMGEREEGGVEWTRWRKICERRIIRITPLISHVACRITHDNFQAIDAADDDDAGDDNDERWQTMWMEFFIYIYACVVTWIVCPMVTDEMSFRFISIKYHVFNHISAINRNCNKRKIRQKSQMECHGTWISLSIHQHGLGVRNS